jgi:hypothetical protein
MLQNKCEFNVYGSVHRNNIVICIQQDATLHSLFFWKLLYMFRVVPPLIIRSANNCIYSLWYLSHRYCYLLLSWKRWNWFECAVLCCRWRTPPTTQHNNSLEFNCVFQHISERVFVPSRNFKPERLQEMTQRSVWNYLLRLLVSSVISFIISFSHSTYFKLDLCIPALF